jgi:thymidylate kinase
MKRGAFILFEGCDRCGKTTQVAQLVDALNSAGIKTRRQAFPDRTTTLGVIINQVRGLGFCALVLVGCELQGEAAGGSG